MAQRTGQDDVATRQAPPPYLLGYLPLVGVDLCLLFEGSLLGRGFSGRRHVGGVDIVRLAESAVSAVLGRDRDAQGPNRRFG